MPRLWYLPIVMAIATPAFGQAPAGSCKVVFDATLKQATTPYHMVATRDGRTSESITTADATYIQVRGTWRKSRMSPKDMLAQQQQVIRNTTLANCKALPDEIVDGKPTFVYQTHFEQKDLGASDAKIWIAKATGLPVRTEVTAQAGEKSASVTHFDYDNIKAPAVQ